jgi:hypothetical protein
MSLQAGLAAFKKPLQKPSSDDRDMMHSNVHEEYIDEADDAGVYVKATTRVVCAGAAC